jgi:tetratricopeptide (TPR) repeat protein
MALLSKATVLPLVAVMGLLLIVRLRSNTQPKLSWLDGFASFFVMGMIAAAALFLFLKVGAKSNVLNDAFTQQIASSDGRLAQALAILGTLAHITILPIRLRLFYDVGLDGASVWIPYLCGGLVLVALFVSIWMLARRRSLLAFAVCSFFLFSLPFLQLISYRSWSLASERFLFLPIFAFAIGAGVLLTRLPKRFLVPTATVLTIAGLGGSFAQARLWGDRNALLMHSAELAPQNKVAVTKVIQYSLLPNGKYDEAERLAGNLSNNLDQTLLRHWVGAVKAIKNSDQKARATHVLWLDRLVDTNQLPATNLIIARYFEDSRQYYAAAKRYFGAAKNGRASSVRQKAQQGLLRIRTVFEGRIAKLMKITTQIPPPVQAIGSLANLQMQIYQLDDARHNFKRLLKILPDHSGATYNLALTEMRAGNYDRAIPLFKKAISKGVDTGASNNNLGLALQKAGRVEAAARSFDLALKRDPKQWHAAFNWGRMSLALGDKKAAKRAFTIAKGRSTTSPDHQRLIQDYLTRCR